MFILIDKPKGITSHDVVDRLRSITGERRIGHAGTLDPNASGLLILGIGRVSTRKRRHHLSSKENHKSLSTYSVKKSKTLERSSRMPLKQHGKNRTQLLKIIYLWFHP